MIKLEITITSNGKNLNITRTNVLIEPVTETEKFAAQGLIQLFRSFAQYHGFATATSERLITEAPDDPNA